jgi:hypothetical protein
LLEGRAGQIVTLDQPGLHGMIFGDALLAYDEPVLLGLADHTGRAFLGPAMDTLIQEGLKAIVLTRGEVEPRPSEADLAGLQPEGLPPRPASRILIAGWGADMPALVLELSRIAAPGSLLTLASDEPDLAEKVAGLTVSGAALTVEFGQARYTDPAVLMGLEPRAYDHLAVLDAAEGRAPATLLALEHVLGGGDRPGIVADLATPERLALARAAMPGATALSRPGIAAAALLLAARREGVAAVLADLLDAQGMQVHLRPAGTLVEMGRPVSFASVVAACRRYGEVALGHILAADGGQARLGLPKALRHSYRPGDRIVVLAPA